MKKLLAEASGVVDGPVEKVWKILLPQVQQVETIPGHTPKVEILDHLVAYQGGWWYRGEWSVEPHPQGTRVVHRVFNVATWGRWGVPLANRFFIGYQASVEKVFAEGLAQIKEALSRL